MKHLAALLNEPELKVKKVIGNLEAMSAYTSEDVRLLAEIKRQTLDKIGSLGLDPEDTTAEELHEALKAKLSNDIKVVSNSWKLAGADQSRLVELCAAAHSGSEVLAIRPAAAKKLFRSNIPKKTMKLLGYRSLESMLKREEIIKVAAVALVSETDSWKAHLAHSISRLRPGDFEMRAINFLAINTARGDAVTFAPLFGAITFWRGDFSVTEKFAHCFKAYEAAESLEAESFLLSSNMFSSNFGETAEKLILNPRANLIDVEKEDFIHHKHLHNLLIDREPADVCFAQSHPALHWWSATGHLHYQQEHRVSMHLGDVLGSLIDEARAEEAVLEGLSHSVKSKLLKKYYQHSNFQDYVSSKVSDTVVTLDQVSGQPTTAPVLEEAFN